MPLTSRALTPIRNRKSTMRSIKECRLCFSFVIRVEWPTKTGLEQMLLIFTVHSLLDDSSVEQKLPTATKHTM